MSVCRLQSAARALGKVDPDLAEWLAGVVRKIKAGLPPIQAMELAGSGARRERDRLMAQAATCLRDPDETWWSVSRRLAQRVTAPPRRPPDTIDLLLAKAGEAAPVPKSARRIYDVLLSRL